MIKIVLVLFFALNLFSYDRIIALSPSINEIIFSLGSGDKIVGNTDFCNYPKKAKDKPKVGGYFSPNLEKILSLKPDIVVMQQSSRKLSLQLEKLGIKTKIVKLTTLQDIKDTVTIIGDVLDKKNEAKLLLQKMQKALYDLKGIVTDKKILIVIGHNLSLEKRIFVAGQNLYFDDIINLSGNTNAFKSQRKGQPILNMENIIATNPDIVILLSPYKKQKGLSDSDLINPWLKLPIEAAKKQNIYIIDKDYAGIASNRLIYFLDDLKGIFQSVKSK